MDLQTAAIGGVVIILSAAVLVFISMFGIKEKSYEEALAEQRQQTNALLGTHNRSKPKEKKVKKANKKVKEKQPAVAVESETAEESEDTESPSSSTSSTTHTQHKLHVEFKEPTIEEAPAAETHASTKKRGKKDKVRSILIHKLVENPVIIHPIDVPPANHFERLHPKDEFELLHSHLHTKEESPAKPEPAKEKSNKPKQNGTEQDHAKEKGNKVRQNSLENKENKNKQPESAKEKAPKEKQSNSSPEVQKQKKSAKQQAANQQQPVEKEEPVVDVVTVVPQTNGYVASTGKEKKKKKGESSTFQQISGAKDGDVNLHLLLNVVRKAELSRSEVQILIDLLLNKQHEAPEKLDEWSEGKADPIQKLKKQLAEKEKALAEEQEALVGVQAKLREIRAEQTAEKSQLQQRTRGLEEALQAKHLELQAINNRMHTQNQSMKQMQAQLNEEGMALRKLRDENQALQLQRQQIDIHISQAQEAEATIQDLQARNNQLTMELHTLNEQNMAAKEHQQGLIVQLQHQVNHFKGELDEKENFNRQFEDLRRDLEHRLGIAHRQESELKVEISQMKSACQQNAEEIRRLEHGKGQAVEEIRTLQKQKDDLDHMLTQLKAELRDVQAEKSELQVMKANGVAQENQSHKEELLNLQNELSSVKTELQYAEKKYIADLDASKNTVSQLQSELDEQKNKNNELRKKNWKVMEALKAAENRTLDSAKVPTINVDEIVSRVRSEEQELQKRFIQRVFPDIQISDGDQWIVNVEKEIQKHVAGLEKVKTQENLPEVTKLQAQVQHYKTIIDDTEGILKKLQNHIEQEEIDWRKQLKAKETEIEALKQQHLSELQAKVGQLELKLSSEQEEKEKMTEAYETLKSSRGTYHEDPIVHIERLTEEVNRLKDQLILEKNRSEELLKHSEPEANDICVKEQNSSSTNGPSIQAEAK